MISTNIDIGQLLIVTALAIIGWFIKRELDTITKRLDRHDAMLLRMLGRVRLREDDDD
jgi:hypothetical protein